LEGVGVCVLKGAELALAGTSIICV